LHNYRYNIKTRALTSVILIHYQLQAEPSGGPGGGGEHGELVLQQL
jgi:hypothetical protein